MLANAYHRGIPLTDYRVSEKYDGLRLPGWAKAAHP
jgi:hypothetical protein